MSDWPRHPTIYEINTWVWLSDLTTRLGRSIDLNSVPAAEWDAVARFGFDAVWLMGVWERSPASRAISNQNQAFLADFRRTLPDFRFEDNVGSPYSVRRYTVDAHLGGAEGLATARRELARRGIKLILDFVPNHVAPDHPWVTEHPEYFIRGEVEDASHNPEAFIPIESRHEGSWSLCHCAGWPDNPSCRNLVAWCWQCGEERAIVVVNLSGAPAQGRIHVPWEDLHDSVWQLRDCFTDGVYEHDGMELNEQGLYVGLGPWQRHLFRCSRAAVPRLVAPGIQTLVGV